MGDVPFARFPCRMLGGLAPLSILYVCSFHASMMAQISELAKLTGWVLVLCAMQGLHRKVCSRSNHTLTLNPEP